MSGNPLRPMHYLRAYPFWLLGAGLSLLVSVAATVAVPQLTKVIIDVSVTSRQEQIAILGGLGILALVSIRSVFAFLQDYLAQRAAEGLAFDLRNALFEKLTRLGFSYHDRADAGQLIAHLTSDVESVKTFAGSGLGLLLYTVLVILSTAMILVVTNWRLALVTLMILPPMLLLLFRFQMIAQPIFGGIGQRVGALIGILQENITNVRVIRVYGREAYEAQRFGGAVRALYDETLKIVRAVSWFFPLTQLFALAASAIVIGVGGYDVIGGKLSLGELVAFSTYIGILVGPLFGLGGIVFQVASATASAKRLSQVFDESPDLVERPGAHLLPPLRGQVIFENVSFRYPGAAADTLQGISFTAAPGRFVAIVGPTGSGKSTLVHLLPRFYDVTGGRITIDGHDIRDVTIESLRQQVAIAPQVTQLFRGTIRENIAFGRPEASLTEVQEAAGLAQAASFIEALPHGYETQLGEAGAGLSGGQQQRIALARALLLRPPILILDSTTSGLDADTEQRFISALRSLPYPCTRLVISERLVTVEHADGAVVLDNGRVVAYGRHQELLFSSPIYAALFGPQPSREVASR